MLNTYHRVSQKGGGVLELNYKVGGHRTNMSNIYFTHLTSDKTDLDMKRDAFESDQAI